jgi:hypothetical protein
MRRHGLSAPRNEPYVYKTDQQLDEQPGIFWPIPEVRHQPPQEGYLPIFMVQGTLSEPIALQGVRQIQPG